jgi:gluconate 2-dehydrogenase gamma chain
MTSPKSQVQSPKSPSTSRRDVLKTAAAAAAVAALPITPAEAENAALYVEAALQGAAQGAVYKPKWFQPDEWRTINVMVDLIIPRDEKSGSATEAGVPQYMDFFCSEYTSYAWMRDALRWFDGFAYNTYKKSFYKCTDAERRALFDRVAWPARAAADARDGVAHFNRLRDFTASGFFSSQMGVKDLGYIGNVARPTWSGCPPEANRHLGVE